ncbi:MAG TPA: hypothetical protein VEL11_13290 [Candidatus Bathyarchaeia archaeon]|nr:hypothetical protein [Candidatus Bathyarchaeia archaeon]
MLSEQSTMALAILNKVHTLSTGAIAPVIVLFATAPLVAHQGYWVRGLAGDWGSR